jgi:spore maturation protein CgeB
VKILCVLGEHNYGDPARGECYEYVNFLPALRNLGHEVVFFESFNKNNYSDFSDLNHQLLDKVAQENPDIILCVMLGYEIWLETLQLIRQGTRSLIISWSTDDSWKYEQFSRLISPYFDLYATTYPDALAKSRRDGFDNFVLTQWAASSEKFNEPLPASQCRYAVSFIGTNYGNRPQWVAALREHGITVDCFGYGWESGPVVAEDIPKIMRNSVISLNFGDSGIVMRGIIPGKSRQIKARVFEVPGAGGFLMTEFADGLDSFFRIDEEIAVFDGISELAKKIKYYLKHPEARDRLAIAGHTRTREEHSYERRFNEIFAAACRSQVHRSVEGIDFDSFKRIVQKHKAGLFLRLLRKLLLAPCVLLWGGTRGPRAARKLLFELSWRLAGKKTYTASGWPGRLFYKES